MKGTALKVAAKVRLHRQLREAHLESQGGKCYFCRNSLKLDRAKLVHKVLPSKGGETTAENTVAACDKCTKENNPS